MPRANRYKHEVDRAAARHSQLAYALRQLEKELRQAAWASIYADYRSQFRVGMVSSAPIVLSAMTERLFKDSENVGARRRRVMAKPAE